MVAVKRLEPDHPAAVNGTTLYIATRATIDERPVLKSGQHSRKIGDRVAKGRWAGLPIYTLTLEERATCPRSCRHWLDCYGNKMHWSQRQPHGPALEAKIEAELFALARKHRRGFVVRLHVLGDFYSVGYVERWLGWLDRFPGLRVFGYSAWPVDTPIGAAVQKAARERWDRFAVRLSNGGTTERGAISVYATPAAPTIDGAIVCPAQTGRTECCGTCALCWGTTRNIAFLAH